MAHVELTGFKVDTEILQFPGLFVDIDELSYFCFQLQHVRNCDASTLQVELDGRPLALLDNCFRETVAKARGELVQLEWRQMSQDSLFDQISIQLRVSWGDDPAPPLMLPQNWGFPWISSLLSSLLSARLGGS